MPPAPLTPAHRGGALHNHDVPHLERVLPALLVGQQVHEEAKQRLPAPHATSVQNCAGWAGSPAAPRRESDSLAVFGRKARTPWQTRRRLRAAAPALPRKSSSAAAATWERKRRSEIGGAGAAEPNRRIVGWSSAANVHSQGSSKRAAD